MTFLGNIVYLRPQIFARKYCSFAALALRARAANDTTRAQINNIPKKSHVIIIVINKQGQMISRMRVLIIQAK